MRKIWYPGGVAQNFRRSRIFHANRRFVATVGAPTATLTT
jgi:hypothetical protein